MQMIFFLRLDDRTRKYIYPSQSGNDSFGWRNFQAVRHFTETLKGDDAGVIGTAALAWDLVKHTSLIS